MPLAPVVAVCLFLASPVRMTPLAGVVLQAQEPPSQTSANNPSQSPARQDAPAQGQEPNQGSPQPDQAQPSEAPQPASPSTREEQKATPPGQQTKPAARTTAARKKPAAKSKTTHTAHKNSSTSSTPENANKKVVKNGSAVEPSVQLAPSMSAQEASSQRQGTSELLASTDENLKKISAKPLPSGQQDMVQQIRKFMQLSKEASDAGDLDRAHNLALKASLLAEELAKP
jgi:hypothetical protein